MIEIYTDASVSKGNAVATCFVLSSEFFLGCNTFVYDNVSSSLHGELLGIRDGVAYALESDKSKAPITVYCDSNSALTLVKSKCIDARTSGRFKSILEDIKKLTKGRCVNYLLIRGHQKEHNPNKVVDLTSNSVLRLNSRKR